MSREYSLTFTNGVGGFRMQFNIRENQGDDLQITTIPAAIDPDGDPLTYNITSGADFFVRDWAHTTVWVLLSNFHPLLLLLLPHLRLRVQYLVGRKLFTAQSFDFEGDTTFYVLTVSAWDPGGLSDPFTVGAFSTCSNWQLWVHPLPS